MSFRGPLLPEVRTLVPLAVLVLFFSSLMLVPASATAPSHPSASPTFSAAAQKAAGGKGTLTAHFYGASVMATHGTLDLYLVAFNGTAVNSTGLVGNYTFTTTLLGQNTSGSFVNPNSGALATNNQTFSVGGLNNTGTYTLTVDLTSHGPEGNESGNFSVSFQVVLPILLDATIYNTSNRTVTGATVIILLDGRRVGSAAISTLSPGGHTQFVYNYTTLGLASGTHSFTLVLQANPGLLVFSNGGTSETISFYVAPPPVNYTADWEVGIAVTVLAIFISLFLVVPRRSRSKRNP